MRDWARLNVVVGLCFAVAPAALAHPGHGVDSSGVGLLHFLLEISHGGGIAILAMAAIVTITLIGVAKSRNRARE